MHYQSHVFLAGYCALQAWKRGLDGVVLDRVPLLEFLGLDRLRQERVSMMQDDFRPLFPHSQHFASSENGEWENEVIFSRLPITSEAWNADRIKLLQWPTQPINENRLLSDMINLVIGMDPGRTFSPMVQIHGLNYVHRAQLAPNAVEVFYTHSFVLPDLSKMLDASKSHTEKE